METGKFWLSCLTLVLISAVVSPMTLPSFNVNLTDITGNEFEIPITAVPNESFVEAEVSEFPVVEEDAPSVAFPEEQIVKDTLRLLELGNDKIEFQEGLVNITLVIGMTGAGKTTVTQVLSGNNSELVSYRVKGSGFLIKDSHQRISTKTAVSSSIFPELVIDNETSSAMYDCPGFRDTRNTSVEIANTLFMKKVTDRAEGVRILVIVSHQSLRPGFTRSGYKDLLYHLLGFIQYVAKFENSIAMIVTKVDIGESDEDVLEGVAEFIEAVAEELVETSLADRRDQIRELTKTLLQQDLSRKYTNIRIFRQPKLEGPLSGIPEVQANRNSIRELVFNNPSFQYQETVDSDFGYVLSAEAMLVSRNLVEKIFKGLEISLDQLRSSLITSYGQKIAEMKSFDDKKNAAESDYLKISFLQVISPSTQSGPHFVQECSTAVQLILNTSANATLWDDIREKFGYIQFLEEASNIAKAGSTGNRIHQKLMSIHEEFSVSINSYMTWFLEMEKLADTFAQKPVDREVIVEVEKLNLSSSVSLTSYDINSVGLLAGMDQNYVQSNLAIGGKQKLDLLKHLLVLIAPSQQGCLYDSEKKLLSVTGHILSYKDHVLSCASNHATSDVRTVVVLATVEIYLDIDVDFNSGSRHGGNLILISPQVKAIGNRKIELNGKGGAIYGRRALEDESGSGGRAGGNGGNFFGAFLHMDGNLQIFANGGSGGAGQDGGNGKNGDDGDSVTASDIDLSGDKDIRTAFDYKNVGCCEGSCSKCTRYEVYSERGDGGQGSDGGHGGVGGRGGYPGTITFLSEAAGQTIATSTEKGADGESGVGGFGGRLGLDGMSLRVNRIHSSNYAGSGSVAGVLAGAVLAGSIKGGALGGPLGAVLGGMFGYFAGHKAGEYWEEPGKVVISERFRRFGSFMTGRDGMPGFNRQGLEVPQIPENITDISVKTLNMYQEFSLLYVQHPFLCDSLPEFLAAIKTGIHTQEEGGESQE